MWAQVFFSLGGNFFKLWFWKKHPRVSLCLKAKFENFKRPQNQRRESSSCVDGADQFYEASEA